LAIMRLQILTIYTIYKDAIEFVQTPS